MMKKMAIIVTIILSFFMGMYFGENNVNRVIKLDTVKSVDTYGDGTIAIWMENGMDYFWSNNTFVWE